jgi:polyisoprenoid-binding protein YceI
MQLTKRGNSFVDINKSKMHKGILFAIFWFLSFQTQWYIPADNGSSIKFKINNFGISFNGSFKGLKGKIDFDPANPAAGSFEATIDASSVNTDNEMRDDHLRKDDYFDVKNYPQIRFISTKVTPSNRGGTLFIFGNLTIRDVTKEISFPFTATPQEGGYLFKGAFIINRRDFNVGGSSFTLSDKVSVSLTVFAPRG